MKKGTLYGFISIAFFAAFLFYPVSFMLRRAFGSGDEFTFQYFGLLLASPLQREALWNSFAIALFTTAATTALALPLAHWMTRFDFRGKTLLGGLILVPMIMPPFVGAIGLKQLLAKFGSVLSELHKTREQTRLSPAALETLAIIAYKQPIIRAQIEAIRGVACGEVLRSLIERHFIKIVGRAEELGRPILYGTTKTFLEVFGLASLDDLPKAEEFKAGLATPQLAKPAPPQANA